MLLHRRARSVDTLHHAEEVQFVADYTVNEISLRKAHKICLVLVSTVRDPSRIFSIQLVLPLSMTWSGCRLEASRLGTPKLWFQFMLSFHLSRILKAIVLQGFNTKHTVCYLEYEIKIVVLDAQCFAQLQRFHNLLPPRRSTGCRVRSTTTVSETASVIDYHGQYSFNFVLPSCLKK